MPEETMFFDANGLKCDDDVAATAVRRTTDDNGRLLKEQWFVLDEEQSKRMNLFMKVSVEKVTLNTR